MWCLFILNDYADVYLSVTYTYLHVCRLYTITCLSRPINHPCLCLCRSYNVTCQCGPIVLQSYVVIKGLHVVLRHFSILQASCQQGGNVSVSVSVFLVVVNIFWIQNLNLRFLFSSLDYLFLSYYKAKYTLS